VEYNCTVFSSVTPRLAMVSDSLSQATLFAQIQTCQANQWEEPEIEKNPDCKDEVFFKCYNLGVLLRSHFSV
jgi:hypothetical protein